MPSLKQIEANRRDAQKSTGPRTLRGKAVSRFNALKSAIYASSEIIRGEDSLEPQDLADLYTDRCIPPPSPPKPSNCPPSSAPLDPK